MENPNVQIGLGVTLSVNADTMPIRYLLRDLGMRAIDPITPSDAHITIIDPYETRFLVDSERDQLALDRAREKAGEYLSGLRLNRWILTSEAPEVVPLRNSRGKVGVILAEQMDLGEVREDLAEILFEEARIRLDRKRPFVAHLTLGTKTKDFAKLRRSFSPQQRKKLKVFRSIAVTGFDINERTYKKPEPRVQEPLFSSPRYRNVPRSVRRT